MELIPMFLGCVFFLVCLGYGIFYAVSIARGSARWRGVLIIAVGFIGLFPLLVVAPPIDPTSDSVSGTYTGVFGGGKQTFILRPDGSFVQRFVSDSGKVYVEHGTWNFDSDQSGSIDFDHMLITFDGFGQPTTPTVTNFGGAGLTWIDDSISFNDDDNIAIHRVRS